MKFYLDVYCFSIKIKRLHPKECFCWTVRILKASCRQVSWVVGIRFAVRLAFRLLWCFSSAQGSVGRTVTVQGGRSHSHPRVQRVAGAVLKFLELPTPSGSAGRSDVLCLRKSLYRVLLCARV